MFHTENARMLSFLYICYFDRADVLPQWWVLFRVVTGKRSITIGRCACVLQKHSLKRLLPSLS